MGLIDFKPKFGVAQLKCILKQILEGIAYLHAGDFIHRDIKGGNILVSNQGVVKLCDFGLARFIENSSVIRNKPNMTTRVVTRWYRAPELLLGDTHYKDKIDIWSAGCVFAELLTESRPPFKGDSDEETLKLIAARCNFPSRLEWPKLETLPNFKAFSRYLWPRANIHSPPQAQSVMTAGGTGIQHVTSEGSSV